MSTHFPYRGRFAPSPTGPLHFGSLVAAVASYLDARHCGGEWRVRIEDLDGPRNVPGAAEEILRTLTAAGMLWDGDADFQSARARSYDDALARLHAAGLTYACTCTRREIADSAVSGIEGPVYPGSCRHAGNSSGALRVITRGARVEFEDRVQGIVRQDVERAVGDFVLRRADGILAYQLAVVVDDAAQHITHVVRGADLLDSTPRQIHLQRLLGVRTPAYLHVPVAVNEAGAKLSKQTRAAPVAASNMLRELRAALAFLGQPLPGAEVATTAALWEWSVPRWEPRSIAAVSAHPAASS